MNQAEKLCAQFKAQIQQPTQLELPLQNTDMVMAAMAARAELYQIMANNLRKEAEVLNGRIERLDAMVAYFSHAQ